MKTWIYNSKHSSYIAPENQTENQIKPNQTEPKQNKKRKEVHRMRKAPLGIMLIASGHWYKVMYNHTKML